MLLTQLYGGAIGGRQALSTHEGEAAIAAFREIVDEFLREWDQSGTARDGRPVWADLPGGRAEFVARVAWAFGQIAMLQAKRPLRIWERSSAAGQVAGVGLRPSVVHDQVTRSEALLLSYFVKYCVAGYGKLAISFLSATPSTAVTHSSDRAFAAAYIGVEVSSPELSLHLGIPTLTPGCRSGTSSSWTFGPRCSDQRILLPSIAREAAWWSRCEEL